MAMDIVFQRKKQNGNRAKVVGVLSVLAKVKTVLIRTDCVTKRMSQGPSMHSFIFRI
jgi:hypothetical protein